MDAVKRLAVEFYRAGLVQLGEFKLSSGLTSPFYIDVRKMYSHPELTRRVITEIVSRIPLHDVEVLAGVESAGIPLATYISCLVSKPLAYVRKEKKKHGTGSAVEGDVVGKRAAIVDDVATTGSSLVKAVRFLREARAIPIKAIVVIDREQGARLVLEKEGVEFHALMKASDVFNVLLEHNLISKEDYDRVIKYLEKFKEVNNGV